MDKALAFSRTVAAAELLGDDAIDRHRFLNKKVLLTGEAATLATPNGGEIARAALMLLIRVCADVTVAIPDEQLNQELEELGKKLSPEKPPTLASFDSDPTQYDAILSVGSVARTDLPWTVINSNGWLVRVSSGASSLPADCHITNPVAAVAVACLGVCEVFKRLISLRPNKGELLDGICYSLWGYHTSEDNDPGPSLPEELEIDALLVGCGAIGNANAYILSRLPITGRVHIIDNQLYQPENWGTCMSLSYDDIDSEKAKVLAMKLGSRVTTTWAKMDVSDLLSSLDGKLPSQKLVLNGLDNVDARHAVQQLWPDLVIDGAIDKDFSCQVSCHPWGEDVACLMCLFRQQQKQERHEIVASQATGLPEALVLDPDAILTEEHIRGATKDKQDWLYQRLGKPICSIVPEAMTEMLSAEQQRTGFSPSVPFVAGYSACLVVAEAIRYLTIGRTAVEPRHQLNLLWGPQMGVDYPQGRRGDCTCVQRAKNIEKVRATRA